MTDSTVLLAHVAATWAMVGVIWMVQLVVYPSFELLGPRERRRFHEAHCTRTAWVVGPLMGVETATGLWLVGSPPAGIAPWVVWLGMTLIFGNWLATALFSVPLHRRVSGEDGARARRRLVATNWVRTAMWSVRGVLVLAWLPVYGW